MLPAEGSWVVLRAHLPLSIRLDHRAPRALLLLGLLIAAAMVVNMGQGDYRIAPLDVLRALLGLDTGDPDHTFIVNTLRLPRMLVAVLVGAGLGLSGTILQGLLRNPLASPDIVGVSAGASLAAVTALVLVPEMPGALLPPLAFVGGAAPAIVIYTLARTGRATPLRLIMVGIGIAAVLTALTTAVMTFGRILFVSQALVWMAGSVYGRAWAELWPLMLWVMVLLPVVLLSARHLNALHLGDDVARGLGTRVDLQRAVLLLMAVALAAACVATAGPIGFVGLMAPHLARQLVGPSHEGLLPVAGMMGALLLVLADLAGRTVFAPVEIPAGVVTAILGAPFFVYLVVRGRYT